MKNLKIILLFVLFHSIIVSTSAQLVVSPDAWDFGLQQTGLVSPQVNFNIKNQGSEFIFLHPDAVYLAGDGPESTSISLLTYNIWFDNQNWPARFAHMLEEIRIIDPDIIGLQEVIQRPNLDNQAKMLADSLEMYYYFSSVDDEEADTRFGNAILSRYPIQAVHWKALHPLDDYRTAIHISVLAENNIVDIYNTHLHNMAVNNHIREEQIMDLLDFIDQTHYGGYIFLTGDFNANPDWEEMELVYEHFTDAYPLFHENHLDPEHGTLNHHLGHQQRRIDYIFTHTNNQDYVIPTSAQVVLDQPDENGIYGSDHFGVFATFDILSHANDFILNNIPLAINLGPGDNINVDVAFAPFSTGLKKALLVVQDTESYLTGEAFDATVHHFPWEEHFEGQQEGEIPLGWERSTENWGVSDSELAGGEAPEMRFVEQPENTGSLYLQTPLINTTGIDSMDVSFRHAALGTENMYDLKFLVIADEQEYVVAEWENPGDIPVQQVNYRVKQQMHGVGEGIVRFAWVFEGLSSHINHWSLDDIFLEALPALSISPPEKVFDPQRINTTSEPQIFALTNIGGDSLLLEPEDIDLQGEDEHFFTLNNISQSIGLGHGDTAEINVTFHPETTGVKNAVLIVGEKEIPLQGKGFDPTITELPWHESFDNMEGGGIPLGWTSDTDNWGAFNSSNAGGEAPEMVFWWQPEGAGQYYLTTPEIITTGMDSLVLSFRHRVNNFGPPGSYTLRVVSITGGQDHLIHEWADPESTDAKQVYFLMESQSHGVGSQNLQLAWVFEGQTDNITQWDIDDIALREPGNDPMPEVFPKTGAFGQQETNSQSEPLSFTLRNNGGGSWHISPDDIQITGTGAEHFSLINLTEPVSLGLFETASISVLFSPQSPGEKVASLQVQDLEIQLTGFGAEPTDYFIYSDFSVVIDGVTYTNVEGFREIPGWAPFGSIATTDIHGEGSFGGVVLELQYDLSQTDDNTAYWMWAYPWTDISGYSHLVLYAKADQPVENIKIQVFDTDGIAGSDGAAFTTINVSTEWEKILVAIEDMHTMDWAENLPDMSQIQRIDIQLETSATQPVEATVFFDLVGFSKGEDVSVSEMEDSHEQEFLMYPNPAATYLNIEAEPGSEIRIISLTGEVLKRFTSVGNLLSTDISQLKPGIYLVNVQTQSKSLVQKLTIN